MVAQISLFPSRATCPAAFLRLFLSFRENKQKARPGRSTDSLLRLGTILLTAAFAGFCLWAIATRMFLERPIQFTLKRDYEATPIPWSKQKMMIPAGTQGVITQIERSYAIEASGRRALRRTILVLELKPNETLPIQLTVTRCEATRFLSKQKMKVQLALRLSYANRRTM
jgi:hypothetical protein